MKKYQNAGRITPGHNGVFPGHAADIDRDELHVVGYRPNRADIVEALTPPRPPDRSWLGTQQRADGLDFALSHCLSLPAGKPIVGDAWDGSSGWVSSRSHRIAVKALSFGSLENWSQSGLKICPKILLSAVTNQIVCDEFQAPFT